MAQETFKAEDPIGYAAWEMAQVYGNSTDGTGNVTDQGMIQLSQLFGLVPKENRALVFLAFLSELDARDVVYDMERFHIARQDIPSLH